VRKPSRLAALLGALAAAAPFAGGAAVAMTSSVLLTACGDENDPSTHVDRLADPVKRPAAVRRLIQFYEDAMTKDKKDRNGPNVKPLLDKIVPPLADLAQKGELDQRLQGDVLGFLADTRDERAFAALTKAVTDYKPDDRSPEEFDDDMVDIVLALREMARADAKMPKELSQALFDLFTRLKASTPKAQNRGFFRLLNQTLVIVADPGWEPTLIKMIDKEIKSAQQKALKNLTDELYWQITSAEILGKTKSEKATRSLIKVVLTPFKANAQTTAINGLIKIGKPAVTEAVKLMNGEDQELKDYAAAEYMRAAADRGETPDDKAKKAKEEESKGWYLKSAVLILGNIGTADCVEPMLAALGKGDKITKSIIGAQLYKLPLEPKLIEAFKGVYTEVTVDAKLPTGDYAKEALIDSAGSFFDKELMGFIYQDALGLKGSEKDVQGVQGNIYGVAVKAATADQWQFVDQLFEKLPKPKAKNEKWELQDANKKYEKDDKGKVKNPDVLTDAEIMQKLENGDLKAGQVRLQKEGENWQDILEVEIFGISAERSAYVRAAKHAKEILDECGDKIDCYMGKLTDPKANEGDKRVQAEKAAYMIGLLGGPEVRAKLVELLPEIKNPAVRFLVGLIVLAKSPKGDPELAKKIAEYVDKIEDQRDEQKINEIAKPLKDFVYRLEARAGK
jgi:hypothetical protein